MDPKRISIDEYLAQLPYSSGHQLNDTNLVIGAFNDDNVRIVEATLEWKDQEGNFREALDALARSLAGPFRRGGASNLVIVGYGPEGPTRSQALADAFERVSGMRTMQAHVHDGTGRVLNGKTRRWGTPFPLTKTVPDTVLDGRPAPLASREALLASVAPLAAPLFDRPEPDNAAALDRQSPHLRVDVAMRALDTLATGRIDDIERMAICAHLVTADTVVSDSVIGNIAGDREHADARTSALVRVFRAAPNDQQPQLAAAAAAAAYLAAWPPPIVQGLLRHADAADPHTIVVSQSINARTNPAKMRARIAEAAQRRLEVASDRWPATHTGEPPRRAAERRPKAMPIAPSRPTSAIISDEPSPPEP